MKLGTFTFFVNTESRTSQSVIMVISWWFGAWTSLFTENPFPLQPDHGKVSEETSLWSQDLYIPSSYPTSQRWKNPACFLQTWNKTNLFIMRLLDFWYKLLVVYQYNACLFTCLPFLFCLLCKHLLKHLGSILWLSYCDFLAKLYFTWVVCLVFCWQWLITLSKNSFLHCKTCNWLNFFSFIVWVNVDAAPNPMSISDATTWLAVSNTFSLAILNEVYAVYISLPFTLSQYSPQCHLSFSGD